MSEKAISSFPYSAEGLALLVKELRKPYGCPWDRKQTIESLRGSLAGECAEVIEAVDLGDRLNLREELGDLLMNIVFMAVVAEEEGAFSWQEVCQEVIDKMVRRHEHVFGSKKAENVEDVLNIWQAAKAAEKKNTAGDSIYAKAVLSMSALDRATEVQKRAAKVNFDWQNANDVMEKIQEETAELAEAMQQKDDEAVDEELGDLLFAAVNLARFRKRAGADELLRSACRKFVGRFQQMEELIKNDGKKLGELSCDELEIYYKQVKVKENAKKIAK